MARMASASAAAMFQEHSDDLRGRLDSAERQLRWAVATFADDSVSCQLQMDALFRVYCQYLVPHKIPKVNVRARHAVASSTTSLCCKQRRMQPLRSMLHVRHSMRHSWLQPSRVRRLCRFAHPRDRSSYA